ncbi:hypothetical protein [Endozoicomonas atrinae]|uniref:hypothetical protein n=1 Tax=Endozoicomonas atrinae TaxID=1333660 RepID=UPI003AFF92D2
MESLSISGAISHCWDENKNVLLISKILKCCKAAGEAFFGEYRVSIADSRESILLNRKLKCNQELIKISERDTKILDDITTLQV